MIVVGDRRARRVIGWAGPWVYRPSGTDPRRYSRIQVCIDSGEPSEGDVALLLHGTVGTRPDWYVEGIYD